MKQVQAICSVCAVELENSNAVVFHNVGAARAASAKALGCGETGAIICVIVIKNVGPNTIVMKNNKQRCHDE